MPTARAAWVALTITVLIALGIAGLVAAGIVTGSRRVRVPNSRETLVLGPLFVIVALYLWWAWKYRPRGALRYVVLTVVLLAVAGGSLMAWNLRDLGPMP